MFSVDATTEEFGNAIVTGQNGFVFAENLASSRRSVTWVQRRKTVREKMKKARWGEATFKFAHRRSFASSRRSFFTFSRAVFRDAPQLSERLEEAKENSDSEIAWLSWRLSFSKSSVLKKFCVHIQTQGRRFQISNFPDLKSAWTKQSCIFKFLGRHVDAAWQEIWVGKRCLTMMALLLQLKLTTLVITMHREKWSVPRHEAKSKDKSTTPLLPERYA